LFELPSVKVSREIDHARNGNVLETAVQEPIVVNDPGVARHRRTTGLVAASVCLALIAGFAGYWYSARPAREQAPVAQPAQSRPPVQPAPAMALTPVTAPATAEGPGARRAAAAPAPVPSAGAKFAIRVATFQSAARTDQALRLFRNAGFRSYSAEVRLADGSPAFAVYLGPYTDPSEADRDRDRARQMPGYAGGFIVQLK